MWLDSFLVKVPSQALVGMSLVFLPLQKVHWTKNHNFFHLGSVWYQWLSLLLKLPSCILPHTFWISLWAAQEKMWFLHLFLYSSSLVHWECFHMLLFCWFLVFWKICFCLKRSLFTTISMKSLVALSLHLLFLPGFFFFPFALLELKSWASSLSSPTLSAFPEYLLSMSLSSSTL